ncbi:hypothetical protein [Legionella massiliensis]|nr:hypothetical protein [Legionella massiliensis]
MDFNYEEVASCDSAALGSRYRQLKTLSHIAVTLNILIEEGQSQDGLKELQKKLKQLIVHHKSELLPYQSFLNETILLTYRLLAKWEDKLACRQLMAKYNKATSESLNSYAKEAAQLQLTSLNEIVQGWTDDYWIQAESSRVLIVCPHGPRKGLIERQFFDDWLLKQKLDRLDKRLIYTVEMLPEQMASVSSDLILSFLSKQEINKMIGKQVLNDEDAMFRDILAEHAPDIINELEEQKTGGYCPYSE